MVRNTSIFVLPFVGLMITTAFYANADDEGLAQVDPINKRVDCSPNRIGIFLNKVYTTCSEHDSESHVKWFNLEFSNKEFVNRALITINTAMVSGKRLTFKVKAPDGKNSDWRLVTGIDMSH